MRKFVFRLQPMLNLAEKREEEEKRRLGVIQQALSAKEQQLAHTAQARRQLQAQLSAQQQREFDPRALQWGYLQLEAFATDLARLRDEKTEILQRMSAQQEELARAMQERKTLEKLHEKQLEAYRAELARFELQTMEESVLPRLAREKAAEQQRYHEADAATTFMREQAP